VAKFFLSPSRIARYYFLECDRYLRFMAVPGSRRQEEGIPKLDYDYSPVTQAVLQGGYDWEQEVISKHLVGRVVIPEALELEAPLHERKLSSVDTLQALRQMAPGDAVYQPTLPVPHSFYERFGLDPEIIQFRESFPDLVMCVDGVAGPELRIVDVKASNWMKLSHRIQVGVYTLILGDVLRAEGIEQPISREGGVWLYGEPEPEWFNLAHIIPPIETFLAEDLMRVLGAEKEDAFWHLNFRCEWCEYYSYCRDEADRTENVSLVPYLSNFAKRHLAAEAGVQTVSDLSNALARDDAPALFQGSASLEGRLRQMILAVNSLQKQEAIPTGAASVSMPKAEQVRLVLTLQSEPLTGEMYAYGIQRVFGKELFGTGSALIARTAEEPSAVESLRRELVEDLYGILDVVDEHNRGTDDWWGQKSVQTYVYDTYERGLLTQILLQASMDPTVSDKALSLLFYFQRPEIVEAENHPDTEVFFPVVALTEVIRSVMALPVPVSYQLAPVSRALAPSEWSWEYRESDFFSFKLSNRMKSNAIFEVWHRGRSDLVRNIEIELTSRLRAANSIINGLRERLDRSKALFAWPPRFFFPAGTNFRHTVLSRLAFIARYESVVGYLDTRTRRGAPLEERLASESTLRLTYLGDDRFELDAEQREADIDADDWSNWLLTADHEAGRRARLSYADFTYRRAQYAPKNLDLALASIHHRESDAVIRLRLTPSQAFTSPAPGATLFLEPRFTDWTTEPLLAELGAIDSDIDPWFVELLSDPLAARSSIDSPAVRSAALRLATTHGMTRSQLLAFQDVLDFSLQLVWGPPGTGKTHFLALAVLCLVEAHRQQERPIRVLITAMTNTAIDNCLAKVLELQNTRKVVGGDLRIGKLQGDGSGGITSINPRRVAIEALSPISLVFGATVWQARKTSPDHLTYDLVVIDEGSQLRVADSAIAIRRLAGGGRLLVAGDDRQLAPIVQAEYPVPEDGLPLHRSILEALRAGDSNGSLTRALVENFRMNDRLCEYPRLSIYPEDYGPATEEIARRRLRLRGEAPDAITRLLIDPDWPVTMAVLEDVKATAKNPFEAALAADLVVALRELLPVAHDDQFAGESVFVVSPHHAQIRLLRRALMARRTWSRLPLVDTVDKMQGQERDAVVVSYGVSDVETALNEKQFIYSLNRLNVAMTRARAKTVLFIPRPLLEPPIQVLDDDEVAEGVSFMQGLMHWCSNQTPPVESEASGRRMTIYRG
jgi:hypothetical protein